MTSELRGVTKRYVVADGSSVMALRDVTLAFPDGSFTVILGRSGCGKTTLLRLLAGLERPDEGSLTTPSPQEGTVGVVFQEPRLMPWLTVLENVSMALPRAPSASEAARSILKTVGLERFTEAMPHQLSGGMAQRVALARALAWKPDVLLMDEPFGALDYFTRRRLQRELLSIVRERGLTVVFVTHDVDEAILLASRVVTMDRGRILDVLENPGQSLSSAEREALRDRILRSLDEQEAPEAP